MLTVLLICLLLAAAAVGTSDIAGAGAGAATAGAATGDSEVTSKAAPMDQTAPLQCPCAYLERGGFWESAVARSLGILSRVYTEKRCSCAYDFNCDRRWRVSDKSLTMTWLGEHGISDSEIQLQFCSNIYSPGTPPCSDMEDAPAAFTLRQVGWWVDLMSVKCRCPGTASIQAFRYIDPLPAGARLGRQIVDFACSRPAACSNTSDPCYQEDVNSSGLRTGGQVLCMCPQDSFCPIYKPVPARREETAESSSSSSSTPGTRGRKLVCQPEPNL